MLYRYRCKKRLKSKQGKQCDTRVTLKKLVESYVKTPLCPLCGSPLSYLDKSVQKRIKRRNCYCGGVKWVPHQKGSAVGCIHYKGGKTDEELNRYDQAWDKINSDLGANEIIPDSNEPPF